VFHLPTLPHVSLPTDTSPYLLCGSASGASCSIVATVYQIPTGTWLGALLALASLAGNLYIERQKDRRRAEADRARVEAERSRKESEEQTQKAIRDLQQAIVGLMGRQDQEPPRRTLRG